MNKINENYLYKPVLDGRYYFSKTDSMKIIKNADNGYILKDKNRKKCYLAEYGWQGYYYKDIKAFKYGKGICYIPEFAYENGNKKNLILYPTKNKDNYYTRKDFIKIIAEELYSDAYKNFFKDKIPNNLIERLAEHVFYIVDWQFPQSYIYETDWEIAIKDYFEDNQLEMELYASEELKNELNKEMSAEL